MIGLAQFRMMSADARLECLFSEIERLDMENSSLLLTITELQDKGKKQHKRGKAPRKTAPGQPTT